MSWVYLFLAGILEVAWVVALKMSDGFTKLVPSAVMVVTIVSSFVLLNLAIRSLPMGVAYAIWTGMGAAGAVIMGIILFKEPCTFWHLFFLSMIIIGLIGIKFVSPE
ncbi:MAG: multidrug efflux SMR transporter [Verrucomicrobiaceae bacterium]|jgi:quaternary ammonium compound-resistance protein SugE|nr:multidrug efflux SMR transporter [Verrucomicrobiaceae bacterium]